MEVARKGGHNQHLADGGVKRGAGKGRVAPRTDGCRAASSQGDVRGVLNSSLEHITLGEREGAWDAEALQTPIILTWGRGERATLDSNSFVLCGPGPGAPLF